MSKQEHRCGKCKWWKSSRTKSGRIIRGRAFACGYPPERIVLPESYTLGHPSWKFANDGKDCLCFEAVEPGTGDVTQPKDNEKRCTCERCTGIKVESLYSDVAPNASPE